VDEIFRFPSPPYTREKLHILLTMTPDTVQTCAGCTRPDADYAVSWIREYGQGRVFYSVLGHTASDFWEPWILKHFLAGVQFALGDLAAALAQIADRPALDALAAARAKATGLVKQRIDEEYAQCAGQFAARVYRQLIVPQEPQMVRIVALGGLAAAIRLLGGIPGPEVTAAMVKEYPNLPPPGQVRLLSALAERGDMSVGSLFLIAAKDANPDVQASAIVGLGKVGDKSSVQVLAEAAANSQGAAQAAARNSLYNLRGPAIDPAIVAAIGTSSGKVKVELIMATGERGSAGAADSLVKAVQEQDPDVHREALKALKNVAGPAQVPGLVDILVNATAAADRRDALQILALVLKRSQPPQIGAVLAAYQKNTAAQARLSLMEVMGQTSSEQALPVLRDALKDPTAEIRRGAILAMTD
jgi:HEAT repeat protein